jgi:broad specificity phosphatase PhoE
VELPARTRLVLVRHAESEGNVAKIMQGCGEYPLSALGRQQAATVSPVLAAWPVTVVAASDLSRAQDTAILATGRLDVVDARLRERGAGPWEGRTRAEIAALYPGALEDDGLRPEGFEPSAEVGHRMRAACADLTGNDGLVVVFTHGAALRVLARELGTDGSRFAHLEGLFLGDDFSVLGRIRLLREGKGS